MTTHKLPNLNWTKAN